MRKIFALFLSSLLVAAMPTVFAAETHDYSYGTEVMYQSTGSENYMITVPAKLTPGQGGTVTLKGTWADNRIVTVTADSTVTMQNNINSQDEKVLNIFFTGISEKGNNTAEQTFTNTVLVDNISDALFGVWKGKFNYNVSVKDATKGPMFTMVHKPTGNIVQNSEPFTIYGYDIRTGTSSDSSDLNFAANQYKLKAATFGVETTITKDLCGYFYGEQSTFELNRSLLGITAEELGEYTLIVDWGTWERVVDFAIIEYEVPGGETITIPSISYGYRENGEIIINENAYIPLYVLNKETNTFELTTPETLTFENMQLFVDGAAALTNIILEELGLPTV